jgi:membrane dipeptidase
MKRIFPAVTVATMAFAPGLITGSAAARADSGNAAVVAKALADMPVIDGHNDLPWEIRDRFASNVDAVDLKQNTALLPRAANRKSAQ